jgi:murein DD-endopeptidase MepM/ murein hydrolase activator NlpD
VRPGPEGLRPAAVLPAAENAPPPAVNSHAENSLASDVPISPAGSDSAEPATHIVKLGETLNVIAAQYDLKAADFIAYNQIEDASVLLPGQVLLIPGAGSIIPADPPVPATQLIPDAELVYGPPAVEFQLADYVADFDGYLLTYEEEVEGQTLAGPDILQLVADRHSVNPRLLLALLEFNAGWLTESRPRELDYPFGRTSEGSEGLYKQASWAANQLNWGFYGRAEGGLTVLALDDETALPIDPDATFGTVGVQNYLAARDDISEARWRQDAGVDGFLATYHALFGDPFAFEFTPLLPDSLSQPAFALPWPSGETWYFSGGPHGGWNSGSAWAAVDFVPPDVEGGCFQSSSWVTAVAPGSVTRSGFGAVVVDLDDDGYAGTGWAVTYMHLDNEDRIAVGKRVDTGDRLGHPGCEGGFTNGTHLHIARTYNGRWISADGTIPFDFDGWLSQGAGYEYNGWLVRGEETKTADVLRSEDNAITAD